MDRWIDASLWHQAIVALVLIVVLIGPSLIIGVLFKVKGCRR